MRSYFLQNVYVPGNALGMERKLAEVARPYVDHVLSENAMSDLAEKIDNEQAKILSENKRLRAVDIRLELDSQYLNRFTVGNVTISFREVQGTLYSI